jgi:hypothetical protein
MIIVKYDLRYYKKNYRHSGRLVINAKHNLMNTEITLREKNRK